MKKAMKATKKALIPQNIALLRKESVTKHIPLQIEHHFVL